ncbi:MAG: hypothetical protein IMX00_04245 [Limnochordales bacterium]|nr:hypothetical protein [Limnochordales bacterium]
MRAAIRQRLVEAIPAVGGRVYEPQAAGPDVEKPYLVVRQGVESEENPWAGFRRIIEVWPYVARTTFQRVDELANQVIQALNGQLLSTDAGEAFTCQYMGTVGADTVDTEWDAITRGLQFAVLALQPVSTPETVAGDAWVEAVAGWTEQLLGPGWTVYRDIWPLGYRKPAVLWHQLSLALEPATRGAFKVAKTLQGHVLGRTPNEESGGVLQIAQGLGQVIKLPLDPVQRLYLTVEDVRADYRSDALTGGQLSVQLSRMTNRPFDEIPYIQRVYSQGAWR